MKTTGTFILILFLARSAGFAQGWEAVEFPLRENITGASFVHPDTGHLVTNGGKHARTFDAGATWWGLQITAGEPLEDVYFLDGMAGYVCGRKGAIHMTRDGGEHWQNISWPDTAATLVSMCMMDKWTGVTTGLYPTKDIPFGGIALRTTDGGHTWRPLSLSGQAYGDLLNLPGDALYCASMGYLNVSRDKGKSWQSEKIGDGRPGRALALSGKNGVMIGNHGMCAYTEDSAKTWHPVDLGDDERHFTCVVMVNDTVGYIGGTKTSLFTTTDGGHTWQQELMAKSFHVLDLTLVGDWLWAVGTEGGIIRKKVR
ncbi:MAG TPA: YCF48-related protein [Acidobacteriota bacterium]|nr:YCF48-related protein [Acidobacteriota bacterium]